MVEEKAGRTAISLTWPVRIAVLVTGAACLGAGGAATFLTHIEGGPVALVAAGVIFGLIGAAGVVPTRIKAGDYEAEFYQEQQRKVADVLRDEVESGPADQRARVQEIVERVAEVAPEVAAPARSASYYEEVVCHMLDELTEATPGSFIQGAETLGAGFAAFDAAIRVPAGINSRPRHVLVEIRGSRLSIDPVARIVDQATWYARNHPEADAALLLVTRFRPSIFNAVFATDELGFHQVTVAGPADKQKLADALRVALSGPPISPLR
jgi:hypothetical protein